jgi:hypothetical protein
MARTEARVLVSIWSDPDFRALGPDAQWAYMFLLSQPDLAHTGIIALRVRRWAQSADGMTAARLSEALRALERARFIVADRDTEELLVRSFIRRDKVFKQPQVFRAAADTVPQIASRTLRRVLLDELNRVAAESMVAQSTAILADMLSALAEPVLHPDPDPAPHPDPDPPGERGVVTEVSTGFPVPRSSDPEPRTPDPGPRHEPSVRGRASPRGTRIPQPFEITADMANWARERVPAVDVARETEKFVNHWKAKSGKDATKIDWLATWHNWLLRATDYATPNGRASPRQPYRNPTDENAYLEGL